MKNNKQNNVERPTRAPTLTNTNIHAYEFNEFYLITKKNALQIAKVPKIFHN